jgi:phytoene dehydrogenase-like protein
MTYYDVVVVGGGLAGLTAAARLARNGKHVLLIERAKIGGRSITLSIRDFQFNFGAHAVYGRDRSILSNLERELELSLHWRDFSQSKAKYDLGDELTDIPASIKGLIRTKMLSTKGKMAFAMFVAKTIAGIYRGDDSQSISEWLSKHRVSSEVRRMLLTLASSNFFTKTPEQIPSDVFFHYYRSLFQTQKGVSYLAGGWQSIISELSRVMIEHGGTILEKTKIDSIQVKNERVCSISIGEEVVTANDFILAIPPGECNRLLGDTHGLLPECPETTSVFVYDIGLSTRILTPYTYLYSTNDKLFVTDISFYDPSCTPLGGQLLQGIAYLEEGEDSDVVKGKMEAFFDKHYGGWRECLVVPRIAKKSVVQESKWSISHRGIPVNHPSLSNLYFAGDWCQGEGQLSELSFSSAAHVSDQILNKGE